MRALFLAYRHLLANPLKATVLVICIALTVCLPLSVHWLIESFRAEWTQRAENTPLVAGAPGSRFDLTLHAMYFRGQPAGELTMAQYEAMRERDGIEALPLLARYTASGVPVVGTSLGYFDARGLRVDEGRRMSILGEAVIGARAARKLELSPGDEILSDPENLFDIAGSVPLKMTIAGILEESGGPDDEAIFVDLKTAWVIAGIGHGHEEMATAAEDLVLRRETGNVVASAAVEKYTEITPENLASFHFHEDEANLPLTAVILIPADQKAAALIRGAYQTGPVQIVVPSDVVEEILALILRARQVLDVAVVLVAFTTMLFLVLTVMLSVRLRRRELETMAHLGASRGTAVMLIGAELLLVVTAGLLLAAVASAILVSAAPGLMLYFVT